MSQEQSTFVRLAFGTKPWHKTSTALFDFVVAMSM
jgi:hypothetical protein